jgi:hypothetical protein
MTGCTPPQTEEKYKIPVATGLAPSQTKNLRFKRAFEQGFGKGTTSVVP